MNVRLQKTLYFNAGIWHNERVQMNNYTVRVHLHTNTSSAADQTIAFTRMQYFVYHELDSSIFIQQDLKDQCARLLMAGLSVTTLPADPVDQLIGIMLYYKLNAIMEQRLLVTEIEIESGIGENLVYLHNQDEDTAGIVKPTWWNMPELLHCDADLHQQDKVVTINRTRIWRELELEWSNNQAESESGNIVVFADFKHNDTE
jgi:hypothetical protein